MKISVDLTNQNKADLLNMIDCFNTDSIPKIGLFSNEKLIGGILLDKDYLPYEYRFDVFITEQFRGKGYLALLINKLKDQFMNDKVADQLSATIINKKLTEILVDKFGFNKGDFYGDDFIWIKK